MIDINELRRLTVDCYWPTSPVSINEILDRLEAAESECLEQARLNGMGASREAALLAKLEAAEKERDTLRAKIEAMERQEPVAWLHETRRDSDVVTDAVKHVWGKAVVGALAAYSIPLCLAPGAQPASSVAEGISRVSLDFYWDSAKQHHIPIVRVEFEPVPAGSPNDAKGWQDRDRFVALIKSAQEARP